MRKNAIKNDEKDVCARQTGLNILKVFISISRKTISRVYSDRSEKKEDTVSTSSVGRNHFSETDRRRMAIWIERQKTSKITALYKEEHV